MHIRHANTAASCGFVMSMDKRNFSRISTEKGACLGRMADRGASLLPPHRTALDSFLLMFHSSPCRMCHAHIAAV